MSGNAIRSAGWGTWLAHLGFWLVICFGAAALGSWATAEAVSTWYQDLNKPAWNPPDWIFPIVWTTLFAMMAISASRISARYPMDRSLIGFLIQLVLNVTWSFLFFFHGWLLAASVEIFILLIAILITAFCFWKRDRWAGLLLLPYAAWVGFASFLNVTLVLLNPNGV